MSIYFTSDTHFGHAKIMTLGGGRPFSTLEEHDEILIENWNRRVKKNDTIYHLGDFSFKAPLETIQKYLDRLNGKKILIQGNHDHIAIQCSGWEEIHKYLEVKGIHPLKHVVLFHYPLMEWNQAYNGSYQLFGHVHGRIPHVSHRRDVAVDVCDFAPINAEEVYESMKNQTPYNPQDNYHAE